MLYHNLVYSKLFGTVHRHDAFMHFPILCSLGDKQTLTSKPLLQGTDQIDCFQGWTEDASNIIQVVTAFYAAMFQLLYSTTCCTSSSLWWSLRWLPSFFQMRRGVLCEMYPFCVIQRYSPFSKIVLPQLFAQALKKLSAAKSMKSFTVYQAQPLASLDAGLNCSLILRRTVLS